jgi:hypothetical protein
MAVDNLGSGDGEGVVAFKAEDHFNSATAL